MFQFTFSTDIQNLSSKTTENININDTGLSMCEKRKEFTRLCDGPQETTTFGTIRQLPTVARRFVQNNYFSWSDRFKQLQKRNFLGKKPNHKSEMAENTIRPAQNPAVLCPMGNELASGRASLKPYLPSLLSILMTLYTE